MEMIAKELPRWFLLAFFVIIVSIVGITVNAFLQEWVKTKFKSSKKGTRFEDHGDKPWVDRFIEAQDRISEVTSNQITMLAALNSSQKDVVQSQRELAKILLDRASDLLEVKRVITLYDTEPSTIKYLFRKLKEDSKKKEPPGE